MKRRLIPLLLCVLMLVGLLAGCGGEVPAPKPTPPQDMFFSLLNDLKDLPQASYSASINVKMPSELMDDETIASIFGDTVDVTIDLSAASSKETGQSTASVSVTLNGEKPQTFNVTDIIWDNGTVYVNFHKLFGIIMSLSGMGASDDYYSMMFPADYLRISPADLVEMGIEVTAQPTFEIEDYPKTTALVTRISKLLGKADYFTESNGTYSFTIDRAALTEIIEAILNDVKDNAEEYADAFIELATANEALLGADGTTLEDLIGNRDEAIAEISSSAEEALSSGEMVNSIPDLNATASISYDSGTKTYTVNISAVCPDYFEFTVNSTVKEEDVAAVTAPEKYLTLPDIMELISMFTM